MFIRARAVWYRYHGVFAMTGPDTGKERVVWTI